MTMSVDTFVNTYNGKTVDVDGAYGGQCWDLWSLYAQNCYGIKQSETNTTSGYADSVWSVKWSRSKALQNAFTRLGASVIASKGDVAFFYRGSSAYPDSHVAIVLADNGNGTLKCLTQNPGAVKIANLTKSGLLGYFRPKSLHQTTPKTTSKGGHKTGSANVLAGTYTVLVDKLNVRNKPSTSGSVVAVYSKGNKVNLAHWGQYADGYIWGKYTSYSGAVRYLVVGTEDGKQWYLGR